MVKIRLWRAGAKNQPFYRIVAIDSRTKRDGAYIDILGTYNPLKSAITLNEELILKWLNDGAKPTNTVRNMLSENGILLKFYEQGKVKKAPKVDTKKKNTEK